MLFKKYFFIVVLLGAFKINAQTTTEQILQQRIEFLSEREGSETLDLTSLLDQWNYFLEHPINLNEASREDLEQLNLLNEFQINSLLNHIFQNGKLLSIYELQSIEFWDLETIELVNPFIKVSELLEQPHLTFQQLRKGLTAELLLRTASTVEEKKGFKDSLKIDTSGYLGSPFATYARFRLKYRNNFSTGFTMSNDAGEQLTKDQPIDFYSFHLFYKGGKYIESIALGDYQIQIGQGVNCWNGYSFGKTSDLLQLKKNPQAISPYVSADESRFFRGAALNLKWKRFQLLNFYSNKLIDGTIDSLGETEYIKSLTQTGLHRTLSELSRKHLVREEIFGSDLNYSYRKFNIGISFISQSYQLPYLKDTLLYNQFDFRGETLMNSSLHYNWQMRKGLLFGEVVPKFDKNSLAILTGGIFALDHKTILTVVYRDYGRSFTSFYSSSLSENTKNQNERGLLMGLNYKLSNKLTINGYFDYFSFSWMKYQVDAPSNGYDGLIQFNFSPSKQVNWYFRYQRQIKSLNNSEDETLSSILPVIKDEYRVQFQFHLTESFSLKNRLSVVQTKDLLNKHQGYLFFQDLNYRPKEKRFSYSVRLALFNTNTYNERLYAYENNVTGIYSVPSYYGKGIRFYAFVKYKLWKNGELNFRYSQTRYSDRSKIGTGLEEIDGNHKTDFVLQFRLTF